MKFKIFVSAPLDFLPLLREKIGREMDMVYVNQAEIIEIKKILSENKFDAWLVSPCPTYMINSSLMDLCPSLQIIATPSTGSNHINFSDAKHRKIKVYSLKGSSDINKIYASSEFTFNLLMSTIRKTPFAFEAVKSGQWRDVEHKYRGRELDGMKVGIIGFGRIGSNLSRYCKAFSMEVMAYDPYVKISDKDVSQIKNLDNLLTNVDIVCVCVHLNKETYQLINKSAFSKMKDGVYFINTSRGDVVNEDDLMHYLDNGKILAAGLDVISDEFLSDKSQHPLIIYAREHDNLIITPHIAGLTFDSERKAQSATYLAIKDYLKERT